MPEETSISTGYIEYPYRPPTGARAALAIPLGLAAAAIGRGVILNKRGLILDGIPLGVVGADILFGILALGFGGSALALVIAVIADLTAEDEGILRLAETYMQVSDGFAKREVRTIEYRDVVNLRMINLKGNRFFEVKYSSGKVTINPLFLGNRKDFDKLCAEITERVKANRKHHAKVSP